MGLLERCHSYKDKLAKGIAPTHGLFAYPILMAADILAYQSNLVPVGKDQKQHLEVTRDLAIKFNQQYGEVFAIPEPSILEAVAVVPGLDGQKMSKSYNNHVEIFGAEKDTRARIMRIVTDSKTVEEPKDPEACTIFQLYRLVATPAQVEEMRESLLRGGYGYGHGKKALFEALWAYFEPFRVKREALAKDPAGVEAILRRGAERARAEAGKTLKRARAAIGLD
jgi:tryptophanyl-tRNA synthetase